MHISQIILFSLHFILISDIRNCTKKSNTYYAFQWHEKNVYLFIYINLKHRSQENNWFGVILEQGVLNFIAHIKFWIKIPRFTMPRGKSMFGNNEPTSNDWHCCNILAIWLINTLGITLYLKSSVNVFFDMRHKMIT